MWEGLAGARGGRTNSRSQGANFCVGRALKPVGEGTRERRTAVALATAAPVSLPFTPDMRVVSQRVDSNKQISELEQQLEDLQNDLSMESAKIPELEAESNHWKEKVNGEPWLSQCRRRKWLPHLLVPQSDEYEQKWAVAQEEALETKALVVEKDNQLHEENKIMVEIKGKLDGLLQWLVDKGFLVAFSDEGPVVELPPHLQDHDDASSVLDSERSSLASPKLTSPGAASAATETKELEAAGGMQSPQKQLETQLKRSYEANEKLQERVHHLQQENAKLKSKKSNVSLAWVAAVFDG